jgi:hypothetical protein
VDPVTRNTKLATAAVAALVVIAGAAGTALYLRSRRAAASPAAARAAANLEVGEEAPSPSAWIDVHSPAAAWKAARESAWLEKALAEPLGQGFAGSWAAFLGTRGTDLAGAFEGTVLDLVAGKLLSDPFRLVFLGGGEATGTPAVLVPKPGGAARGAYQVLEAAVRSGRWEAARCPGADKDLPERLAVSRWLVAEHAVFAGQKDGRLALAKNPLAVVQALCAELPAMKAGRGVDLSVTVARDGLGREALLGASLLGLSRDSSFLFGLEGGRLVPRGISGKLEAPAHLEVAAPREELLRLLPADAGVVLLATLNLPDAMDRASLQEHLAGKYAGKLLPRTVALVWNPTPGESQVAIAWPERDARALREAFTGPNRLVERRACGHVVLASTPALASAMERACGGKGTSLLHGAPAVVAGLKEPVSLGVNVNAGAALSRVLGEAFAAEHPNGPASPEIEAARRLLEELPFLGLRGVARGGELAPGGFRS